MECYYTKNFKKTFNLKILILFLSINLLKLSNAHVGLTFPPARKYDLDFLDNIRTQAPCGMPKGSTKTSLISGSNINITWHLSYPHQGGYRLELMDSQERQILDLTPKKGNEEYIRGDPTAQWYETKLPPSFTCTNCTIRLLREASEWSGQYRFWSCADVDIIDSKYYKETCFNHGRSIAGRCLCNKGYWGKRCQYEDECETDSECTNGNGKCIDLGGSALPRKQCFCYPGFHGEKCKKRNNVRLPDSKKPLDLTQHTKKILSNKINLYYKIIPSKIIENKEIEFILEIDGTSYGALGWRPASFKKSCQRWPFISNTTILDRTGKSTNLEIEPLEPKPEAEAEPESSKPEPNTAAEAEPKPEPSTESKILDSTKKKSKKYDHSHDSHHHNDETESNTEPISEPKSNLDLEESIAEPEANNEPKPEPKSDEDSETTTKEPTKTTSLANKLKSKLRQQKPKIQDATEEEEVAVDSPAVYVTRNLRKQRSPQEIPNSEPEPKAEPSSEAEPKSEPEPEPKSEPEPEPKSEPEPEGEPIAEPEGEPSSSASSNQQSNDADWNPNQLQAHQWSPKSDFHAMDCIDLIMGGARGSLSRILDYYTRDRSTPRLDSFWGGKDDLTSATGWEKDSKTILIFRRRIKSTEGSDHSLDSGEMHVIWARGQEPGNYIHNPKSGLEAKGHIPSLPNFYAADEIKYHGHGGQRGKTRINFFEKNENLNNFNKNHNDCENNWRHPPGCSNDNNNNNMPCTYIATWKYLPSIDSIKFTIESRKTNKWTGIGFGENPTMKNSDTILGWVTNNGRFFIMDSYMKSYSAPVLDEQQNIQNQTGIYENGIIKISFIRSVVTQDPKDISLDKCQYFLFPIEGGSYDAVSKKIGKHEQTPLSSSEKICIPRKCTEIKLLKPNELTYEFNIKLIGGFANNWNPPKKGTEEFNEFNSRIKRDLIQSFNGIQGFNQLELLDITKIENNQVLANIQLNVKPESELSNHKNVENILKKLISNGRAGSLQVDSNYLELSTAKILKNDNETEENGIYPNTLIGPRLWIVIGCVAALILLAILQAILTIFKSNDGKKGSHKDSPSSGSAMAWRDYSEVNYGYEPYDEKIYNSNNIPLNSGPIQQANNYYNTNNQQHSAITNLSLPRPNQSYSKSNRLNSQHHQQQQQQHSQHQQHYQSSTNGHTNGNISSTTTPGVLNGNTPADFYFMPSQRKYSGEVVRVYVDHNKIN